MIDIIHLSKTFETKDGKVEALKDINIRVEDGDIYGIIGMSGAGKSTLVRCINMIERPTEGSVIIDGVDMGALSDAQLRRQRQSITMIFQSFNLLMQRTCLKNVCFPLELAGMSKADAKKRAMELLETVGLPDKANSYPAQLSGGQQQRVAIARALATEPKVLLCDEATSALDPKTTNQILDLIREINQKLGITVIVITHQMSVVENICNKVSILDNGEVVETGTVTDVFGDPQSLAGKRLVFPDRNGVEITQVTGRKVMTVSFNNAEATDTPLIAQLAKEKGILASILYASTKSVGGKAFGKMILGIMDEGNDVQEAMDFMNQVPGVIAKIEDVDSWGNLSYDGEEFDGEEEVDA